MFLQDCTIKTIIILIRIRRTCVKYANLANFPTYSSLWHSKMCTLSTLQPLLLILHLGAMYLYMAGSVGQVVSRSDACSLLWAGGPGSIPLADKLD